jgi:hypothetical protein
VLWVDVLVEVEVVTVVVDVDVDDEVELEDELDELELVEVGTVNVLLSGSTTLVDVPTETVADAEILAGLLVEVLRAVEVTPEVNVVVCLVAHSFVNGLSM